MSTNAIDRFDHEARRKVESMGRTTVYLGELLRHPVYDRILHWSIALFFFLALFTGFGIYLPWLFRWFTPIFGGGQLSRIMHPYFGVAFVVLFSLQALNWLRLMLWAPGDTNWMRNVHKIVSNETKMDPPETGFFNAGQKVMFWEIVAGCVVYLITGIIMWAGADILRRNRRRRQLCPPRHLRPHHARRNLHPHLPEHLRRAGHLPGNDPRRGQRSLGLDLPSRLVQASHGTRPRPSLRRGAAPDGYQALVPSQQTDIYKSPVSPVILCALCG